jgi:protein-S-isoprenylcysteine O-methyltransferase Ste14
MFEALHRHAVDGATHVCGLHPRQKEDLIVDTARYVFGVLVVTFLPPGLLWWFLIHPFVGFWRGVGPRNTLIAMGVIGIGGAAALYQVRDALLIRDLGTGPGALMSAFVLFEVSVVIALKRRKHLDMRTLAGVPELAPEAPGKLLTEGIYASIRHPRYVEICLGSMAYAVFSMWLGALIVATLTFPIVHLIVLLEEQELADRFGEEFERYRARVPRYVPRFGRSSKS